MNQHTHYYLNQLQKCLMLFIYLLLFRICSMFLFFIRFFFHAYGNYCGKVGIQKEGISWTSDVFDSLLSVEGHLKKDPVFGAPLGSRVSSSLHAPMDRSPRFSFDKVACSQQECASLIPCCQCMPNTSVFVCLFKHSLFSLFTPNFI